MKHQARALNSKWTVKSVRSHDDLFSIRYAVYQPSSKPPSRFIVYFNGRTEWIEKNSDLPELLQLPDDCAFLTLDHRGQGASGGPRAYVKNYDDYMLDAKLIIDSVTQGKPYAMLAHSMGGLIAIYGTCKKAFNPYALALSAPLLRLPAVPLPNALTAPLTRFLSSIGFAERRSGAGSHDRDNFHKNILTHDFANFEISCNSPYRVPSATFGWISTTFDALSYVFTDEALQNLSAPTLVMSAGEEAVVDPRGHRDWVKRASEVSKVDTQLLTIHGARHELFSESHQFRDRAISAAQNWLKF